MSLYQYEPVLYSKWFEREPVIERNTHTTSSDVAEALIEVISGIENMRIPPLEPAIKTVVTATRSAEDIKVLIWTDIANLFSSEKSVVEIWADYHEGSVYVLSLIKTYDREARRRLIQLEREVIDKYYGIDIDFSILALEGDDPSELVTDLVRIYPED